MPTDSDYFAIGPLPRKWLFLTAVVVVGVMLSTVGAIGVSLCFLAPVVAERLPVRGGDRLEQLGAIVRPHLVDGHLLVEVIIPHQWSGTDADLLLIGQVSNVAQVSIERDLSKAGLVNLGQVPSLRYIDATGLETEKAAKMRLLRRVCAGAEIHDSDERAKPLIDSD